MVKQNGHFMDSRIAQVFFRLLTPVMDSRFRSRFFDPVKTLDAAGIRPGERVLEVGCGTGFFTIPAAALVGERGRVYAVDPHPLAIRQVSAKMRAAGLTNVTLIRADAMEAGMTSGCVDLVMLLGVIPAPVLPLDRLLPEMHRLLRAEGRLAVWTAFPWWSPASVTRTGLFVGSGKENGVHRFTRASV